MRPFRGVSLLLALVVPLSWAADARGNDCVNPLINSCINSETYWPNAGPMRFTTIAGTETVGTGQVAFGMVGSYVSRPVVLRVASPGPGGSDAYVVDNQVNANFLFAYGITNRLQLDFALPVTFIQSGAGTSPVTGATEGVHDTAMRDLRFGFAYALVPRARISPAAAAEQSGPGKEWSLTSRLTVSAPTGDSADFAGERTAVFVPSLAADYRLRRFFFGLEVGARMRPVTEFAGARVGTQLVTGLGAGFDILDRERLAVMLEARAYPNFAEQHDTAQSVFGITSKPNGRMITPAEWMLAVRSAPLLGGDVSFFAGGGGPIPFGDAAITTPRFRFLLGAVYAPTDRDTDGDGVIDKHDLCPTSAGVRGTERPGCPNKEP